MRRGDSPNTISLSNRKGRRMNFGTWAVSMVGRVTDGETSGNEGGGYADTREGNGSLAEIASEHQRKEKKGEPPAFSTSIAGGKLERGMTGSA